ncbi:hypothetical protein GOY07_00990 [Wolbachia endosymbiont of Litomosoides sigmodontis]|uniref:hypothetical protein n=1 Tax=Wolbachia endosymbiont of Litomosoides sigmodontis TaxID=80850 RepID=UPI001588E683|nr:hypothetical protein [Wolbachia endosymbiont of Litomosoides sigmodontis]QKX02804.1 hypothetical protein GOY07_00990 [Wolbachia endosymbiont of Litomosoides sigmodontis]
MCVNKIKESNKNKDEEGKLIDIDNEYCFYFILEDKDCYITIDDQLLQQEGLGNLYLGKVIVEQA